MPLRDRAPRLLRRHGCFSSLRAPPVLHSFPTRRSSDLSIPYCARPVTMSSASVTRRGVPMMRKSFASLSAAGFAGAGSVAASAARSEEHTSELQSLRHLVCRLLLETKKHDRRSPPLCRCAIVLHASCAATVVSLHCARPQFSTLSLHDALPIYRSRTAHDR